MLCNCVSLQTGSDFLKLKDFLASECQNQPLKVLAQSFLSMMSTARVAWRVTLQTSSPLKGCGTEVVILTVFTLRPTQWPGTKSGSAEMWPKTHNTSCSCQKAAPNLIPDEPDI